MVTGGILQELFLRPVLFTIFINSLSDGMKLLPRFWMTPNSGVRGVGMGVGAGEEHGVWRLPVASGSGAHSQRDINTLQKETED